MKERLAPQKPLTQRTAAHRLGQTQQLTLTHRPPDKGLRWRLHKKWSHPTLFPPPESQSEPSGPVHPWHPHLGSLKSEVASQTEIPAQSDPPEPTSKTRWAVHTGTKPQRLRPTSTRGHPHSRWNQGQTTTGTDMDNRRPCPTLPNLGTNITNLTSRHPLDPTP